MIFPEIKRAKRLIGFKKRLFIGAYGFEERTTGWLRYQSVEQTKSILDSALMFSYDLGTDLNESPNKVLLVRSLLKNLGCVKNIYDIGYNWEMPNNIEDEIEDFFSDKLELFEEIIVDISTMSKYLIMVCLLKLRNFNGDVRVVYSEAKKYTPSFREYQESRDNMTLLAKYPSHGVAAIARARCLSSIRMQGQPVTLLAFTSFNEQLVRHLLGTMNPHQLILINGRPPVAKLRWREKATQEMHKKLLETFPSCNPLDVNGLMKNSVSTLNYKETILMVDKIYKEVGNYERIICGITGSKMQTIGLYFSKILHPDIHFEYPTPSSYYVEGLSVGVKKVHEIMLS